MKYLVIFVYRADDKTRVGNARGWFAHTPPTMEDVWDMEKTLAKKYGYEKAHIVNWLPLQDE